MRWLRVVPLVFVVVVGPWPSDNRSYEGTGYERVTLARLAASRPSIAFGDLHAGIAEVDISPPVGHPLFGASGRKNNAYRQTVSHCFARALTFQSHALTVTILTADLLLIDDHLAHEIIARTGLSPAEIYFTATHTHTGPGAYGRQILEQWIGGRYDSRFFDTLAGQLAACVMRSRSRLAPAEIAVVSVSCPQRASNRISSSLPTDDRLSALIVRLRRDGLSAQPPAAGVAASDLLAVLAVFGAHATVMPFNPALLGADYPGALVDRLRSQTGAEMVAFAAGAVGDATPNVPDVADVAEQVRLVGEGLADDVLGAFPSARFDGDVVLATIRLDVELPTLRIPIGPSWSFSPICTAWITSRSTHLHALRVGPAVLIGFPGDYTSEPARRLSAFAATRGLQAVSTSFNGDYKGYLTSRTIFLEHSSYETRIVNFFGPWCGEWLTDLAERLIDRLVPR